MALEKIIDKILSETRKEADSIIEEAGREADGILEQGRKQADAKKDALLSNALDRMKSEKFRNIALAKLESRKAILKARCELVDRVFALAEKQLNELADSGGGDLKRLMENLIGGFVPEEPCEIIVFEPESDKYTLLLSSLWGDAFTMHCRISPVKGAIGGGIILRTKRMEYDCTFSRMIAEKRQQLEQHVVRILFPDLPGNGSSIRKGEEKGS